MATSAMYRQALEARHSAISHKIEEEQTRPGASEWYLKALKRQKLHLKEQIEGIS